MLRRSLKPLLTNSFFIFGARGTGKSTLVKQLVASNQMLHIDLLIPENFEKATFAVSQIQAEIEAALDSNKSIFIDEVQKAPRLLDLAHSLIEKRNAKFILTGSSARKLKRGGANLLAGRAYTYYLHPLTAEELGSTFDLDKHLAFGGLPRISNIESDQEKVLYLRSYVTTYLKEEIAEEQVVRNLEPFSKFLQVAAQLNGKILNYSAISRDVSVSDQTIKSYYQILSDTLLGDFLPPFSRSFRKSQGQAAKFYLFDPGIVRTLLRRVDQPISDQNYGYGDLFESFVISEIRRRAQYAGKDFEFSFIRTPDGKEIDLIIDRPGRPLVAVEIKSTREVKSEHVAVLHKLSGELASLKDSELLLISRDTRELKYGNVRCLPWHRAVEEIVYN